MQVKKTDNRSFSDNWIGRMLSSVTLADGKINFVSWGGAYTASQVKACIEPLSGNDRSGNST